MEKIYEKEVEKRMMTFKTSNPLSLPEALDQSVVVEMDLNEEDKNTKESKKMSRNTNDWCTPLGMLFLLLFVVLLGIGGLLLYSLFK